MENEELLNQDNELVVENEVTTDSYAENVENARVELSKAYKKGKTRSNIMMVAIMVTLVGCMILITRENATLKLIGWIIVGVAVVGMIVFYALTKNILPKKTKEYIKIVNDNLNGRNFSDSKFIDLVFDQNEKLELGDVVSDGVYKATSIGSRNVVNGMYSNRSVVVGDLALYKNEGSKNRSSAFVGKYVSYPNDLHFEGRFVFDFKKKEDAYDQPDDISDLSVLLDSEDLIVYGKENTDYVSILGKDFVEGLKNIKLEGPLYNLIVVVWSGHSAAYMSYGDEVIALPFENEFDMFANEQYRQNLLSILNTMELIKK